MSDVQAHAANCRMAKIAGWHSATIFLTDLGGTVTQHDGNFLAVDGFPFFDGKEFGGYCNSNYDGNFTAVTRHDGNFLAVDGFRFLTVTHSADTATQIMTVLLRR